MSESSHEDLWLFGYGSLIWKPPPLYGEICVFPDILRAMFAAFGRYDIPFNVAFDPQLRWQIAGKVYAADVFHLEDSSQSHSQDHRGTPEAPGRVATLIDRKLWESLTDQHASAPPRVWGAAYRIPPQHVAEVKEYLDIREINGYSIQYTPFNQDMSATYQTVHASNASNGTTKEIKCLVYIGLPDNPQFVGPQDPQALAEHIVRSRGPSGENIDYLYQLETALNNLSSESGDEHVSDLARRCREIQSRHKTS